MADSTIIQSMRHLSLTSGQRAKITALTTFTSKSRTHRLTKSAPGKNLAIFTITQQLAPTRDCTLFLISHIAQF